MKIALSILIFSTFDYIGYNLIGTKDDFGYRVIQIAVQVIMIAILWYFFGFITSLSFILLWWFGIADLLYYVIDGIIYLIFKKSYENGLFWKISYNNMNWLWFTPLGLLGVMMNKKLLVIQSVIGILITVIINIVWQNI